MPKEKVIARLIINKEHFEILVDPELAWLLKNGKDVDLKELLVSDIIYKDARKGEKASETSIIKNFGTTDLKTIVTTIIRKGELQLTTEQRRQMIENKKKQIIAFIARNCVDPHTGLPHPPTRIENAIENIRISIDPFKPVEQQANDVIKALRTILPLKISQVTLSIHAKKEYASKVKDYVSKTGELSRSEWLSDGSWRGEVTIPAGIQQTVIDRLNEISKGDISVNIIRKT
ncbi:MAG: ribosome assembly factor SBDS [Candidatus Methanomethylicia archaeon]|jgi:ribosome maturation protein SDO1|nr:ribosome assembly factor SBDS [Candidatus Methanomethylicia archaeon]MCQ5340923.1 ribosome assembly factor SBDS [Candidatus Methanomethylicia archaeon]NHV45666.1 ribosome assembly factor SBDS [Candidatus Verstraetearchaeota archaeon]